MSQQDQFTSAKRTPAVEADRQRRAEPPRRRWPRVAGYSLLGLVVAGLGFAAGNYAAIANLVGGATAAPAETAAAPVLPDTPFLEHVKQAGVQACSTVYPALGQILTNGTKYSVKSLWNDQAADKHAIQAFVGMDYASERYSGPAAGIVFASPTATGCEGAMVRVAPFASPCADIASILPQGSKITDHLGQVEVYELGGNAGEALLLPTGKSCVVISLASAAK
ncbi:hypothetical protein EN904_17725 [Mesorhizobium sp. M7A.F.Ca.CA.001.07.2.1]|jgi:hypothetical protein|uniref:hypothetical protein n=1 Tax=Mesorhizobium TaxID=68287 RepID=UPI000FCC1A9D|nr:MULTISPECIES: hypothetical protein [Mesorhizobium]RVB21768.1 hypothetical protein EN918_30180 [Mesorhizobium sp. M7A.F.Ca.CA.004.05.1.1]MCF6127584.1 hypothetical protein [Mesorhizobium ciceri]MCQ8818463.1 hypothetical protein [Mesorhizobium sp. SEMIA396]RUX72383.1 hypothetical protein EN983_22080 [Mesorhizobium sp. M7A.F.Ca.CA.004.08.2.1]RUX85375.1 hypothetical protein EN982_19325 [Mesorhizobium sp. M7A.F.Ca.CA.004.08.1.1]